MHFTNQFGQETEVLDPTINEFLELGADPFEMQERLTELRQQSLEQAILRCETEMRQRYFTDPASFTPALLKGLNIPAAGGAGGAAAVGVGARAVEPHVVPSLPPKAPPKPQVDIRLVQLLEKLSLVNFANKEGIERLEAAIGMADQLIQVDTTGVEPLITVLEDR
ncbi:Glutamyl-tRNA(Gln) amidotransferase subunit C, mitochondrial [Portunus trituberculatus]|uniref:Glutamyl-tRNA(Gln) amidotransferase subunit C, mitochondrial n=1 Tax=Portunus trituberculatus TaxID=210409 RepID=A0A5B7FV19_PORTR|nr:Glutamyl-tRNA(Gln) amidotransferase subunit C, mitochondrial [Portunus trituberculatus]